jgi:hypothetical protein
MIVLAIDPGPTSSGIVLYDHGERAVLDSMKAASEAEVLHWIESKEPCVVAVERVQSYGIAGGSLLQTAEVGGGFRRRSLDLSLRFEWRYRREILKSLDITGKGSRDSLVRNRLIEIFGGTKEAAIGKKASPGPLYGVSSHAWQALAVAVVVAEDLCAET